MCSHRITSVFSNDNSLIGGLNALDPLFDHRTQQPRLISCEQFKGSFINLNRRTIIIETVDLVRRSMRVREDWIPLLDNFVMQGNLIAIAQNSLHRFPQRHAQARRLVAIVEWTGVRDDQRSVEGRFGVRILYCVQFPSEDVTAESSRLIEGKEKNVESR
jgi:hypothetical protein